MLRRMALVKTDVSEEPGASFIRVTRISELGTTHAATSKRRTLRRNVRRLLVAACVVPSSPILVTLMNEALGSSETSVLTRATWRNIPEDTILHFFIFALYLDRDTSNCYHVKAACGALQARMQWLFEISRSEHEPSHVILRLRLCGALPPHLTPPRIWMLHLTQPPFIPAMWHSTLPPQRDGWQ
jgi:hypothetical protein